MKLKRISGPAANLYWDLVKATCKGKDKSFKKKMDKQLKIDGYLPPKKLNKLAGK